MKIDLVNLQSTDIDGRFVQRVTRRAALEASARSGTVSIALVDDARIAELNRAHRKRNRPTDVLAYEGDEQDAGYLGDVVISVETAARQAGEVDRPVFHEVAWLAAHGMLHLLGYDDATAADRAVMIERQDRALAVCLRTRGRQDP